MRPLLLFLLLILPFAPLSAQCSGGTNAGALSPAPSAAYQTMNVTTGNYYTFTVAAGCLPTYDFSFCSADGSNAAFDSQITILDNTGAYAGGYSDDFCGLQSHVTWTPTAAGTYRVLVSTYSCGSGNTALLAYKQTTPPAMTYTSSTVVQSNTAAVAKCDVDADILQVQVVTSGTCTPLTLTQIQMNMTGSTIPGTNTNDVFKIHVYYTGTSAVFATSNEFFSGGTTPAAGTISINGSQVLASGTNYFWIAYDMNNATATTGNLVDAQCTQLTISAVNRVPSVTAPAGNRSIAACSAYPGAGSTNLKTWLRANTGVTLSGSSVTQWNDQSGAGITGNFIVQPGTPAQTSPTIVNNALNYNPYISFNGTTNSLASNNQFTGNSIFGTNNNTIFMVHNLQSGIVYFKWETIGSGAYRVGYELNGSTVRFDFVDDAGGMNALGTTNVVNKDVLVTTVTNATASVNYLNAKTESIKTLSGLNFSPGATTKRLCIGNNDITTNNLPAAINYAEMLVYNTQLTQSEIRRVESYLAIKYGITLKNNQGTGPAVIYKNSSGSTIWGATQTGYHNNVTGIGRDDVATLDQRTSRGVLSLNTSLDAVTIVNGTFAAPAAFTSNISHLVVGHNGTSLQSVWGDPSFSNYPAALGANAARIQRVWQAQATNFTQNTSIGFESTLLVAYLPISNLRLLVDDDGNFANGGTTIYSGAVMNGTRIEFSGVTNLGNTGNKYFSLATINYTATPLPVSLLAYSSSCSNDVVELRWSTASETMNDYFRIERSEDAVHFSELAHVNGSGTSSSTHQYHWFDEVNVSGTLYYRLSQVDFNGQEKVLGMTSVSSCAGQNTMQLIPNPTSGNTDLRISSVDDSEIDFVVYNALGEIILSTAHQSISSGMNVITLPMETFGPGVYFVKVRQGLNNKVLRLVKY